MKALTITLPSGRKAQIQSPKKALVASVADLSILGSCGRWYVYEIDNSTEVILVEAETISIVKGVGPSTLKTLIETTSLTPELAVAQGMANFSIDLPESGYYILKNKTHVWTAELPQKTIEENSKSIPDPF